MLPPAQLLSGMVLSDGADTVPCCRWELRRAAAARGRAAPVRRALALPLCCVWMSRGSEATTRWVAGGSRLCGAERVGRDGWNGVEREYNGFAVGWSSVERARQGRRGVDECSGSVHVLHAGR